IDFLVATSDNEELSELFSNLYERIITGNVMGYNTNHPDILARMEAERNTAWYKSTVHDGVISIMSDAYPIRCPNILTIRKEDGVIVLEFDKIDGKEFHEPKSKYDISINIRQSGSRIYDLAFPFRLLFRELQSVNIEDVKEKKLSTNM
ncbi:MAG: hypothetical protein K2G03_06380, partial [Bacilli bacterium]|nr:hypothetical protein [Bacilli bacterium]